MTRFAGLWIDCLILSNHIMVYAYWEFGYTMFNCIHIAFSLLPFSGSDDCILLKGPCGDRVAATPNAVYK